MEEQIEVSVICMTYNQKEYLRMTIDNILSQETTFAYEIIVHDDNSNDGTKDIIDEYVMKYGSIIRPIFEKENQYSKNIDVIPHIVSSVAKGKYIALCEGDDYWIDNKKLQIQYNILEKNSESDMCACWGCTTNEDGSYEISQIRPRESDGILTEEEVILGGGQFLVTAGLFFRKSIYDDMMGLDSLDYSLQIRGGLRGGIQYIDRKMAVYRRYAKGSWTNEVLCDDQKLIIQWNKEKTLLNRFDEATKWKYHDVIMQRMKAYVTFNEQLIEHRGEIKRLLSDCEPPIYIWGWGRRGKSLEAFLDAENIVVDGICDAMNCSIDLITNYGNRIVHTDDVIRNGKTILVSTKWAYDDLLKTNFCGKVYDLFQYMPNG